jgi:hypothetical protein
MGADKNSSPKRELGLCPKFTTKDSHTSLSRSRSHNVPTNPRNRPQLNPTQKHNSKSKGHRQSGKYQADCPECPRGLFARRARTIREEGTDHPKMLPEPPVLHRENRIVPDGPADRPPRHGPSASSRTVRHSSTDRLQTSCTKNPPTKRIEIKALKNSHEHEEQPGCQAPRGRSAVTSLTVRGDLADGPR